MSKKFNFSHRRKRQVPGLNAASMADVSFMLLIFFLVTTSMDSDKGLFRKMPRQQEKEEQGTADVLREDVLLLHIQADGSVLADDILVKNDSLTTHIAQFIEARGDRAKQAVIKLQTDSLTQYEQYFNLQETILQAYASVRDKRSMQKYNKPFSSLNEEQREAIRKYYPQRISE